MIHDFQGMRVIESPHLEQDGEPRIVRRTWRERWTSRPWRPWIATKTIIPKVPFRGALQLDSSTLVMHPETMKALREAQRLRRL